MYKNELLLIQHKGSITKSKRKVLKEKAVEYYLKNKEAIKEESEKEKDKIKGYQSKVTTVTVHKESVTK